jgi:hypothetical protein
VKTSNLTSENIMKKGKTLRKKIWKERHRVREIGFGKQQN